MNLLSNNKKMDRNIRRDKKQEKKYIKTTRTNILGAKTSFATLESYRSVRTNIMFSLPDETGCRNIVVTSAMPGDGKTTTCINLAITFGQAGKKVLVIDCDMRCPRIHLYLGSDNEAGLSNVLAGFADVDEVVRHKEGVYFITAGLIPQNPAELLSSQKMEKLIEKLSESYDYIFFDTPPLAFVADAVTFLKNISGVILIARQKYTLHHAIEAAVSALTFANAKVLGFILNDADSEEINYKKRKYGNNHYQHSYYYNNHDYYRNQRGKYR